MDKNGQKCPDTLSFLATLSGVFVRFRCNLNLNPPSISIILRLTIPHLLQSDDWLKSSMSSETQTDRHTDRQTDTQTDKHYFINISLRLGRTP